MTYDQYIATEDTCTIRFWADQYSDDDNSTEDLSNNDDFERISRLLSDSSEHL